MSTHQKKSNVATYSSSTPYNDNTSVALPNNDILDGPSPIPVNLHGGLAADEDEAASRKLLVSHVGAASRYQGLNFLHFKVTYPNFPPIK